MSNSSTPSNTPDLNLPNDPIFSDPDDYGPDSGDSGSASPNTFEIGVITTIVVVIMLLFVCRCVQLSIATTNHCSPSSNLDDFFLVCFPYPITGSSLISSTSIHHPVQRARASIGTLFKKLLSPIRAVYSTIRKRRASYDRDSEMNGGDPNRPDPPQYDNIGELPRYVESERRTSRYGWSEPPPPYIPRENGARSGGSQIRLQLPAPVAPRLPPPTYHASSN
ncbi:hypothetical protein V8B97DRAFT_2007761 [Scleroderma yunnanense]